MNLLGDFLKARRGRVDPGAAALGGRRRVPGLRREELARLAGISEHYLTRLEQGVDRHPSPQVLLALARALVLNADETAHLLALAAPSPAAAASSVFSDAAVSSGGSVAEDLHQLLDAWPVNPAYVRDRRFDVLAANKLAVALAPMYAPGANLVRSLFQARDLFPDWAQVAAQSVAALRAEADLRDPRVAALVAEMLDVPSFRELWERHDARPVRAEQKRFAHPIVGELTLRRQALTVAGAEDQAIIVYLAEPGSPSADALSRLL